MMTRRTFSRITALFSGFLFGHSGTSTAASRTLREDIPIAADWISQALKSSGYGANFTPASIAEIERFFSEQVIDGQPRRNGLLAEDLGKRLFAVGSYCGEVLRKELGGTWITDDNDPEGEIDVTLELGNGVTCWPVQRVIKRLRSDEENLVHWANSIRRG